LRKFILKIYSVCGDIWEVQEDSEFT